MSTAALYISPDSGQRSSESLLLEAAALYLGMERGGIAASSLRRTEYGKPFFPDLPLRVSVSHTGRKWACLVAGSEVSSVGLDIQAARHTDHDRIAARFFTDTECTYLKTAGEDGFFRLWTRKEALTKYLGLPLGRTLAKYSLTDGSKLLSSLEGVRFYDIDLGSGIYCAAALPAAFRVDICIKEMSAEPLPQDCCSRSL